MKVLVDISENVLTRMKLVSKVSSVDGVCQAVLDGTVLDNLTNGDVIKAMFETEVIDDFYKSYGIKINDSNYFQLNKDWWNAPYKVEDRTKRGLNYADQDTLMSAT